MRPLVSALVFCHVQDITQLVYVFCLFFSVLFFSLFTAYKSWDTHRLPQENHEKLAW